jgi:hypothetical protein
MPAIAQGGAGMVEAMKEAGRQMSQLREMQLASVHKVYSNGVPGAGETGPALLSFVRPRRLGVCFSRVPARLVSPVAFGVPLRRKARHPDLVEVLTRFAKVYARVTYSGAGPPPDSLPACEAMWDGMVHGVVVGTQP